jgi:hypothetical protein
MLDKCRTNLAIATLDQREDAGMNPALIRCGTYRIGHDLTGAGMCGMAFDHDRAAGRKRCCRVASGGGKR